MSLKISQEWVQSTGPSVVKQIHNEEGYHKATVFKHSIQKHLRLRVRLYHNQCYMEFVARDEEHALKLTDLHIERLDNDPHYFDLIESAHLWESLMQRWIR